MLSNIGEVKSDHDSLQVSSLKMINNNPDQQINLNCENNNVRIDVTELYESQKLVIDIGHESLEIFSGFLENKDVGTKKHQNEKNSQTGLKSDPSDSKKAKNYRHLFRHEDDEYFVPDYLVDQVGDEKLQSENSQRQTADKKEPPNSLPRKKKTDTISVEKDVRTKRNVDKDQNDETLRDEAQPSLIIPGNQKHTRKLSRQKTLSDTSSSELDEFSDSNTSSSVSSSSFFSDSSSEEQKNSSSLWLSIDVFPASVSIHMDPGLPNYDTYVPWSLLDMSKLLLWLSSAFHTASKWPQCDL